MEPSRMSGVGDEQLQVYFMRNVLIQTILQQANSGTKPPVHVRVTTSDPLNKYTFMFLYPKQLMGYGVHVL